jgi:hypothetical protein
MDHATTDKKVVGVFVRFRAPLHQAHVHADLIFWPPPGETLESFDGF